MTARLGLVADVRSVPKSRSKPGQNIDILPQALKSVQIGYLDLPDPGRRRPRQPGSATA